MANEGLDLFADGFSFLELPRWHEDRLWAADIFAGQVVAFAAAGLNILVVMTPIAARSWLPATACRGYVRSRWRHSTGCGP